MAQERQPGGVKVHPKEGVLFLVIATCRQEAQQSSHLYPANFRAPNSALRKWWGGMKHQ